MSSKEAVVDPAAPNAKEALFFKTILSQIKSVPDVDWEVVATESGYANGSTAKKRFQQIKAKQGWGVTNATEKASPGKTRAAKKEVASGVIGTPSKVVKTRGRTRKFSTPVKKNMVEEADAIYEDEEVAEKGEEVAVKGEEDGEKEDEDDDKENYEVEKEEGEITKQEEDADDRILDGEC